VLDVNDILILDLPFEDENVAILLESIISASYYPFPKHFS
jgi:hypothetical protein